MAPARQSSGNRVPEVPRPAPVDDSEDVFDDVTFSRNLKDLLTNRLDPGPTELAPGGNLVATGDRPVTSTETTSGHWRNDPKAKIVNFGSGKLKATQKNLGAAVGLTAEQAGEILQASRNLAGDTDELSRKFHEADEASRFREGKNVTYGPMSPEASRIAQQLADAQKQDQLGAQIRAAMVDGDKPRLKSLLRQAGLPYGDWL